MLLGILVSGGPRQPAFTPSCQLGTLLVGGDASLRSGPAKPVPAELPAEQKSYSAQDLKKGRKQ